MQALTSLALSVVALASFVLAMFKVRLCTCAQRRRPSKFFLGLWQDDSVTVTSNFNSDEC